MADRSLPALIASGMGALIKSPVGITDFGGPVRDLTGVGFGRVREPFTGAWQRNMELDGVTSLASFAPIYACVTRIANDIAKLGLLLMEEQAALGITEPAVKTSPYWQVLRRPNSYQNRIQFVRHWLLSKLLFGNAYGLKFRDARGIVTAVYLLSPRRVTPLVTPDGGVYYSLSSDNLARIPSGMVAAPASEIIHDRGATLWHELVGVPPIFAAALSGTLGLRIQQNSAAFFANHSRPGGVLKVPGEIDAPTHERMKREWDENYRQGNSGRVALLTNGISFEAMPTAYAEQAQLAEQLGISAVDVATAFGMPAYKINQGAMPTNNNVQALNQQYYSDCLQTYIEDFELCATEGLGLPPEYSVEFDLDGLLRMDSATQMDVLTKGVAGSTLKIDEARRKLNMRPVTGGSTIWMQQQNYSTEALMKRDRQEDPFHPPAAPAPAEPPTPEPAPPVPVAGERALENLLGKALDDTRAAIERAATAEAQQQRAAEDAAVIADAQASAAADREAGLRAQAAAAIERAQQAEQQLSAASTPADPVETAKALADALLTGFEALEPACG